MTRARPLLAAVLLLLGASAARADVRVEVRSGFGGRTISGAITPVRVLLHSSESEPVSVSLTVSFGRRVLSGEVATAHDLLGPGADKVFTFYLRAGPLLGTSVDLAFDRPVRLVESNGQVHDDTRTIALRSSRGRTDELVIPAGHSVILAVGANAQALPSLASDRETPAVLHIEEVELPTSWMAFDGIETVYWRDPGSGGPIDPVRVRALLRYVRLGGRLVISSTRRPELLADSALGAFLPALPGSPVPQFDYSPVTGALALRQNARPKSPIDIRAPLTPLTVRDGAITLGGPDLPLAVEARRGIGWVTVLAFDPNRYGNRADALGTGLLSLFVPDETARRPGSPDYGYSSQPEPIDAIGRLLRTGAVTPPPIGLLSLFMVLYVLAVGPLDYFVLKRYGLLKYSALTLLGLAVVFSVAAWIVSFWLFGGSGLTNRFTFVDIVPGATAEAGDRESIHDFAAYYAPRGGTVEVRAEGESAQLSSFTAARAAMEGGAGSFALEPLRLSMQDPLHPVGTLSLPFRALRTVWSEIVRERTFPLEVTHDPDGGYVVANGLPYRIRDAAIVLPRPRVVLYVGDLEPGQEVRVPNGRNLPPATGNVFRHGFGTGFRPDTDRIADIQVDHLPFPLRRSLARSLLALSVASAFESQSHRSSPDLRRLQRQTGVDLSIAISRGAALLLAWTDEKNPFGLSTADEAGFTLTVLRKVFTP